MAHLGEQSKCGRYDQIQAEAWKSVFKSLNSNPQAFILFDSEYRVLGRNQAAVLLAEQVDRKIPGCRRFAAQTSSTRLAHAAREKSSKKPGKALTPLRIFAWQQLIFRYIFRL